MPEGFQLGRPSSVSQDGDNIHITRSRQRLRGGWDFVGSITIDPGLENIRIEEMWVQGGIDIGGGCGFVSLEGLWVDNPNGDGIYATDSYWLNFEDVAINSAAEHGINLDGTYPFACNVTRLSNVRFAGEGAGYDSLRIKGAYLVDANLCDFSGSAARLSDVHLLGVTSFKCSSASHEGVEMTDPNAYPIILEGANARACTGIEFDADGFPGTINPDGAYCLLDGTGTLHHSVTFRRHNFVHQKAGGGTPYVVKLTGSSADMIRFEDWPYGTTPQATYINSGAFGYGFEATGDTTAGRFGKVNSPTFAGAVDMRGASRMIEMQGTTAQRPAAGTYIGQRYYDTTLSKPIWSDGSVWRDAAGTAV